MAASDGRLTLGSRLAARSSRRQGPKVPGCGPKVSSPAEHAWLGSSIGQSGQETPAGRSATMADRVMEELDENECLRLIAPGGIGRIAYSGRFGPAVLPVNYKLRDGAIVFRTAEHGPLDEDLRTGIANADYRVAFEIDEIDPAA